MNLASKIKTKTDFTLSIVVFENIYCSNQNLKMNQFYRFLTMAKIKVNKILFGRAENRLLASALCLLEDYTG